MTWIEITNTEYIDGYKMALLFNDGQKRVFDFLPLIEHYPRIQAFARLEPI